MKLLAAICMCLALGLVATACGGDDEDDSAGNGATTEQTTATETTETDATETDEDTAGGDGEQVEVDVVDTDYEPREVTVAAGSTITWTNTGDLPHTVTKTEGPGDEFDSGVLETGDTYEQTLDSAGTIDYVCTIHPNQRGTITVER